MSDPKKDTATAQHANGKSVRAEHLTLTGHVQGVGFRPFVYRLAQRFNITGWVQNRVGQVDILAQGTPVSLDALARALIEEAPAIARPRLMARNPAAATPAREFQIKDSDGAEPGPIHVPPDYFTCADCLRELHDPRDRRFRYPFINCTQCGPRYTLIRQLPYDRSRTTMAGFALCADCQREYQDPTDRRFHAEPVACPRCGPQLQYVSGERRIDDTHAALDACIEDLRAGRIVAVKGIGGYHLMCDAYNRVAVEHLRQSKPRPHKPLAVMFPVSGDGDVDAVQRQVTLTERQRKLLRSPMRPIVLAVRHATSTLPEIIAPGLNEIGVMLPYSPLHHLLIAELQQPLVATSANISGEPVLTEAADVDARLRHVADAVLHHDRPIQRPADDAVYRLIADAPRPLRLGRGNAPFEYDLPYPVARPTLAVGGHMKNTVALAWGQRVVVSPHIGDLGSPRSRDVFAQVIRDLQQLYGIRTERVVADAHPGYGSSQWAERSGLPVQQVFHHRAHAAALAGEYADESRWLVFTWDGVGLGEDGSLWGGEALLGAAGHWQRVASMRTFRLPGGERAARAPWRCAAGLCWEAGHDWAPPGQDLALLRQAWQRGLNAPVTSAVGRVFDAAAALTGVLQEASFEGQGPMLMEALAQGTAEPLALPLQADCDDVLRSDWSPLIEMLQEDGTPLTKRAAILHSSLATALVDQACAVRAQHGDFAVGLGGGVFQNRQLSEQALARLAVAGFRAHLPQALPCNDGGLCYGQIIETAAADAVVASTH